MSQGLRAISGILPLLAFWWVESEYGLSAGVVAALGFTAAELGFTWWRERRLDRMALGMAGLIVVLGGLSLWSEDERFFLIGPALGDLVFAGLLVLSTVLGRSVLVVALREQDPELDLHPLEVAFFEDVGRRFAAVLLLHALIICWAVDQPRWIWTFLSGPGQMVMMAVQLAGEVAWGRLVLGPRVDAALAIEELSAGE